MSKTIAGRQFTLDLGHRTAMGREDFLVSPASEEAVAWIDKWPDWPAPALVVHGPAACGKTHLLHVWATKTGGTVMRGAELNLKTPETLPTDIAAVAVDDLGDVQGDAEKEEALLHLYNLMRERGGHVLVTADRPPGQWTLGLADLDSRLKAAPAAGIGAPDDALLAAVLLKQFSDRQMQVGGEVIAFLLPRIERSLGAVRDLVESIDATALELKRPVTVPLVRRVLDAQQPKLFEDE